MSRLLIIDDHPIFRRGLAATLSEAGGFTICGEGASAETALALAASAAPDLVLLDLSMPGGGLAALTALRERWPALRVVILTASEQREDLMDSLRAGAAGYIVKGIGSPALIEALRGILRGESYVAPALAARILSASASAPAEPAPPSQTLNDAAKMLQQLTPREGEVLQLVASGWSNKEIAREAKMQEKTVKHHMTRILQKLKLRNRTEAALFLRGENGGRPE
ncbi:response regulator [Pseudogemmobacter faecipullorum]|uniref:Response regulator transcription factor n=1 Tax=Pseudogemmobacter faecipullorum TaxID=2755041 RepID=A0ABS8CJB5_9RHOB|nr:response regulator transcription factor [Pseudogemmobacter faecipullorum]MCB5409492.1 response regulator transcription factor [Pseudogemmobacter faecipullorum]